MTCHPLRVAIVTLLALATTAAAAEKPLKVFILAGQSSLEGHGFIYGVKEDRIGPELDFGHVIGEATEEPVLLLKLAWGGKSLEKDIRPPSAGGDVGPFDQEAIDRSKAVQKDLGTESP